MTAVPPPPAAASWSLRGRLTRRVLIAVSLGWLASLVIGMLVVIHETNELLDDTLKTQARLTLKMLRDGGRLPAEDDDLPLRIITPQGIDRQAPWPALDHDGANEAEGWHVYRLSDAEHGLVVELGQPAATRWKEIREAARALLLLMMPTLALVLVLLRRTVTTSLAPALRYAHELDTRPAGDTSPLPTTVDLPRELRPIPKALNSYLQRIEALLQSERQFAANAAHELRTPLAAASAQAQLIAAGTADPEAARRLTQALQRLAMLVERLLQLSRAEAGIGSAGTCDLIRVIRLLMADHDGAHILFDDADCDRAKAGVDADVAALILGNLLRNAIDHGTGQVTVRLRPETGVVIQNRVAPDAAFHPGRFEKSPKSSGAGLGLVIVESLARSNDVTLDFVIADGLATVRVGFPPPRHATPAGQD